MKIPGQLQWSPSELKAFESPRTHALHWQSRAHRTLASVPRDLREATAERHGTRGHAQHRRARLRRRDAREGQHAVTDGLIVLRHVAEARDVARRVRESLA
jgi:hypothetical protein